MPFKSPPRFGPFIITSNIHTPVKMFKTIIKHDDIQFRNFNDETHWDTWHRNALATTRTKDVAEVLEINYAPSNPDEDLLFVEKNKFMYSVFVTTLKTDRIKKDVREHERGSNAHSVYKKLEYF